VSLLDHPLVQRAVVQHELGQLKAALDTVRELRQAHPNDADLHYLEGRFLDEHGLPEAAVQAFAEAIALDPDHRLAWNNLAYLEGRLDPDTGIARHRELLDRFGDDATIRHNLGCLLRDQGQLDQAFANFQRALALDGRRAAMWVNLGDLHRQQGNRFEAIAAYQQALAIDPELYVAHEALDDLG
jgi:tetratricopeptide (TPR) repeat protein